MKNWIYISIIIAAALSSCEKELDFEYHEVSPQLVIEGILDGEGVNVTLTHTTPMAEKIEEIYLTDAEVTLIDQGDNRKIILQPNDKGIYYSSCSAMQGRDYSLLIKRDKKEYRSSCKMRPASDILGLKFQWIKMPYDYVAVLEITFKDLGTNDCYWLKIYRNDEPYKWIVSDGKGSVGGVISEVIMTSRKDLDEEDEKDILKEGDVVKVTVNAISKDMFDYLTAIQNDSNGPAMFTGDFCLGYFIASESVSDHIIFHPEELTQYQ